MNKKSLNSSDFIKLCDCLIKSDNPLPVKYTFDNSI